MALEKIYTANGSEDDFNIVFSYLEKEDVSVAVEPSGGSYDVKTLDTHYTISGDVVTFTTGNIPPNNSKVRVRRSTQTSQPRHTYYAGSSITANSLNTNYKQILYALEEFKELNAATLQVDVTANSIGLGHMADNSIDSDQYVDGSIDNAHLANLSVSTGKIQNDAVTAEKLADSINTEIAANTAKVTNATHTGEVTGATALTIASNIIDEDNLKVDVSPTNDHVLTAKSSAAGGLTWAASPSPLFTSYAILQQIESSGTHSGASSTSWATRVLNTETADPDGIVTLSSNQFTLGAGSYFIEAEGSGYDLGNARMRIYDVTNSVEKVHGHNGGAGTAHSAWVHPSHLTGRFTASGTATYELQQISQSARGDYGHGHALSLGGDELFATVQIYKES